MKYKMKLIFWGGGTCFFLLGLLLFNICIIKPPSPSRYGVICDTPHLDFGEKYNGTFPFLDVRFELKNNSKRNAKLKIVKKSCGCIGNLPKTELISGEQINLVFKWKPSLGDNRFSILISDGISDELLTLSGHVRVKDLYRVTPQKVVFQELFPGKKQTKSLQISPPVGINFKQLLKPEISSDSGYLNIESVYMDNGKCIIDISAMGLSLKGVQQSTLSISTGNSAQPTIMVNVETHHLGRVTANPSSLFFKSNTEKFVCLIDNTESLDFSGCCLFDENKEAVSLRLLSENDKWLISVKPLKEGVSGKIIVKSPTGEIYTSIPYLVLGG